MQKVISLIVFRKLMLLKVLRFTFICLFQTLSASFAKIELTKKIKALASKEERLDIDVHVYRGLSIKRGTRESRGSDARVSIQRETPIIKSARGAKASLQNEKNKVELFSMFADILIESCQDVTSHIISTKSESAVNNKVHH